MMARADRRGLTTIAVALVTLSVGLAGCGGSDHHRLEITNQRDGSATVLASESRPTSVPEAGEAPSAAVVAVPAAAAVALAFVQAVCPFTWTKPYPVTYNQALAAWTTPSYAAAHTLNAQRASLLSANMVSTHETQSCTDYQAATVDTGTTTPQQTTVRITLVQTTTSDGQPANSAADFYTFVLDFDADRWRISADASGG